MTPIRVRAFYTRYPHWGAYAGGHQVCRHMDAARVDVSLQPVSDSDADWPLPASPLNTRLRTRFARRGMAWYKLSDLAAEMRAIPACMTGGLDVVHYLDAEHTAHYLPGWLKRARWPRVKTVGTFHQPPELLPDLVNRDIVSQLDLVLVVSPSQEAFFRAVMPAERVRTLLHGVDADFFRPGGARRPGARFMCITAGHWMRDWNAVRAVVETLAAEPDIEFHIVTNRDTGLSGLGNVTQHVDVDDEALRRLYQQADALFLPLVNATANNSLLEGMACGLPVISTEMTSVRAYTGEGPAILVEGNDPGRLARALLELRGDVARRERMAQASRARAEALAWPRIAPQWERTYAALVHGS